MFFIFLVLGECIRRMQINGFYARMFLIFSWISTLNNQKRTYNAFRIIRQLIIIFVFLRQILRRTMTKLSVNINKIATLRNARGGNVPVLTNVTFVVRMYMICVPCCGLNSISKGIRHRNL